MGFLEILNETDCDLGDWSVGCAPTVWGEVGGCGPAAGRLAVAGVTGGLARRLGGDSNGAKVARFEAIANPMPPSTTQGKANSGAINQA